MKRGSAASASQTGASLIASGRVPKTTRTRAATIQASARRGPGLSGIMAAVLGEAAAFLAVSALVIVTPGQDTALTIRSTLGGGRRAGVATAGGVAFGQAVWSFGTAAGLAAVLLA